MAFISAFPTFVALTRPGRPFLFAAGFGSGVSVVVLLYMSIWKPRLMGFWVASQYDIAIVSAAIMFAPQQQSSQSSSYSRHPADAKD